MWEIVDLPKKSKDIFCMWILKKNRTAEGEISRYKARLVICDNQDDATLVNTFSPVMDFTVVRLILAVASQKGWLIHQVYYSNAFIQGKIDQKVYMSVPEMKNGVSHGKVFQLLKNLYGLREAPRIWYDLFSEDLKAIWLE